jgi:hypothetical protein
VRLHHPLGAVGEAEDAACERVLGRHGAVVKGVDHVSHNDAHSLNHLLRVGGSPGLRTGWTLAL